MTDRPGVRFAIAIPQHVASGSFDPAAFRGFMARAEALGFESAWTQEQVLGDMPSLGPLETMAYAAACSDHIRLGCAVLVSTLHSPLHLAKSIATLDQLSRGRIEVGLGSGGRYRAFAAFDVDPATFVGRFTEGLALLRACWTEPRIDFEGRFWQVQQGAMEPKPVQSPNPPVWLAGGHPDALRRAVRLGDGFFGAGSSTTAQFVEHADVVRATLDEAGRERASFPIAKRVYVAVGEDGDGARREIADALNRLYGFFGLRDIAAVAVAGTPADCVEGLQAVADAGADLILLNPMGRDLEQMGVLATEVVPHVERR
jgi:probable F420-dependent oxidoreductase